MSKKHVKTPAAVRKAAGNTKYVASVHGNKIYYTDAFYRAMYDALHAGKNPVEAYKDLGFNVEELGENRAFAAAQRAEKKAEDGFVNMDEFDGTKPRSAYGKLTPDQEIAYFKARNLYLEMLIRIEKKNNSNWKCPVSGHRPRNRRRKIPDGVSGIWITQ